MNQKVRTLKFQVRALKHKIFVISLRTLTY